MAPQRALRLSNRTQWRNAAARRRCSGIPSSAPESKPPPAPKTRGKPAGSPVGWASLGLTAVVGGAMLVFYNSEKERILRGVNARLCCFGRRDSQSCCLSAHRAHRERARCGDADDRGTIPAHRWGGLHCHCRHHPCDPLCRRMANCVETTNGVESTCSCISVWTPMRCRHPLSGTGCSSG